MKTKNPLAFNPLAFPRPQFNPQGVGYEDAGIGNEAEDGMTLRDYFAGQALSALVTEGLRLDHESWAATAQHAYIVADALLTERSK